MSTAFDEKVQQLLTFQPDAIDIRLVCDCHCGAKDSQLFYALPEFPAEERLFGSELMMVGGIFCTACDFSAGGAVKMDVYENGERFVLETVKSAS